MAIARDVEPVKIGVLMDIILGGPERKRRGHTDTASGSVRHAEARAQTAG